MDLVEREALDVYFWALVIGGFGVFVFFATPFWGV